MTDCYINKRIIIMLFWILEEMLMYELNFKCSVFIFRMLKAKLCPLDIGRSVLSATENEVYLMLLLTAGW